MASNSTSSTIESGRTRSSGNRTCLTGLRSMLKPWIIVAVLFYCASVITVGLLAGLLPKRTQYINIIATPTIPSVEPHNMTSITTATMIPTTTTTVDPSLCIDDECSPRLLTNLIVHSYILEYTSNDTTQTTAQGQVTIEFTLKEPTKQIIYHSKGIVTLEEPALFEDGVFRFVSMRQYTPNDYITLRQSTDALFAPNRYKLVQSFIVNLTYASVGFYQSSFKDSDGTTRTLLATKFRTIEARKAFPCFDEPQLKATFQININHPENTVALANFPIAEEDIDNGLRRTKFEETFKMSTYLAAWAVLPDTYGQKSDDEDQPLVTVWARQEPTEKNYTDLPLDVAMNSIEFLKNYYGISEALPPNIDILTIPEFGSAAVENWGLISFREDVVAYDAKIASTHQKQESAYIVAHEIGHSWMGNYVSCKWWDDLWFSEAVATWVARKVFTANYSDWNMELQAVTDDIIPAMWDDAKPSSHSIVVNNITDVNEIIGLLDAIAYSKGASMIRMLEKMVGSEKFRAGLQEYLVVNAFDVGDLDQFFNGLLKDMGGAGFIKTWLNELNYPLLNVNLQVESGETRLVFTQSRFIISNALNSSGLDSNYRWKIHVQCVLGGNFPSSDTTNVGEDTIDFILEAERETRVLPGKSYSWIKCNRNFENFLVTEYSFPTITWQRFTSVLEAQPTFFNDEDKANLMQDTFLLAYKGLVDYTEPLRIVRSLITINITEFAHWKTFQWHWETLANLIDYLPETLTKFQNFAIQKVLSNGVTLDNILSLDVNENHNTKLVKNLQFEFLCRMNHVDAIQRATTLFKSIPVEYFNNGNVNSNVAADFLSTVYTYHLKNDDNDDDWNRMFNYYKIAASKQEQTRALFAISSTNNRDRLNRLLQDGLSGGPNAVNKQDYFAMMGHMSRHPIGREAAWAFYKDNYEKLVETFTLGNRRFTTVILSITRTFEKESYLQEMIEFFARYPDSDSSNSARQRAIDQVKMNIEWVQSREQNLRSALDTISRF